MLTMAAANAVGALLFATVYAAAGARYLSQGAYIVCLLVLLALVTTLWVRMEARHRSLPVLRRLARILGGFAIVAVALPATVLTPLFWLDRQLPPEAGLDRLQGPAMAIILVALVVTGAVNVLGGFIVAGRGIAGRGRPASGPRW